VRELPQLFGWAVPESDLEKFCMALRGDVRAVLAPAFGLVPDLEHCEEGRTRLPAAGFCHVLPSGDAG
jgi:hypothetical protein